MKKGFIFLLVLKTCLCIANEHEPCLLPGRLGSEGYHMVQIGDCELYFYMTPEKDAIARQVAEDAGHYLSYGMSVADSPSKTFELTTQVAKDASKDPNGALIFHKYFDHVHRILEKYFHIHVIGLWRDINANLNWEALRFHHDRFIPEYAYLSKLTPPIAEYTLIQDLTLVDWQMAKNTLSATVVQDGDFGDRYLICFFPGEVVGTFYTETAKYAEPNIPPKYPGHITLPYHTGIPPMDFSGTLTSGSPKGKRISTNFRGVVLKAEMDQVRANAQELSLNRRKTQTINHTLTRIYDNGILLKSLPDHFPETTPFWVYKYQDRENVDICGIPQEFCQEEIQILSNLFDITKYNHVTVTRLTKKDGGFSRLDLMNLNINSTATTVLVNRSQIPEGYRYFTLAQDFTKKGLPWIQLYLFEPSFAMCIPFKELKSLAMTPVEELLFSNERFSKNYFEQEHEINKLVSILDIYVFE